MPESFIQRLLGRDPENPVTVRELRNRLADYPGHGVVKISREMISIKLGDERARGLFFLDDTRPSPDELAAFGKKPIRRKPK